MLWIFIIGVILTLIVPHFGAMILAGGFLLWMVAALSNNERY
jgi:hypothetical protein